MEKWEWEKCIDYLFVHLLAVAERIGQSAFYVAWKKRDTGASRTDAEVCRSSLLNVEKCQTEKEAKNFIPTSASFGLRRLSVQRDAVTVLAARYKHFLIIW